MDGSPPQKRIKAADEAEDAALLHVDEILSQMSESIKTISSNQAKLLFDNTRLTSQVSTLTKQVKDLKHSLNNTNQLLLSINNGQKRLNRINKDHPDQSTASSNNSADDQYGVALPAVPSINMDHPPRPSPSNTKPISTTSDNNLYLVDLLLKLHDSGCLNRDFISKSILPSDIVHCSGNKSYIRYCLELAEFVSASNDELTNYMNTLSDQSANEDVLRNAAEIITTACAEKIEQFDSKRVRKKTAIGIGSRVRDYKKKIAQVKQSMAMGETFTAENVELMEKVELDGLIGDEQDVLQGSV